MPNDLISLRRRYISKPLMAWYAKLLPSVSETERQALEAGSTWWEAELFAGRPDWDKLRSFPTPRMTAKEQAFVDGPTEDLCQMLNDWQIEFEDHDLSPAVWEFLKSNGFFGIIIPEQFGGLGFSALAHSEVVKKISTRSITAAVTVMVPNSLGPGELLLQYGTDEQRQKYLSRLACGEEIPCFALTGIEAGSDASSMTDTGIVCKGLWEGQETIGVRINWEKRYITLAPVATLMGLAFKLYDPEKLLGEEIDRGITVALVPTNLPGVKIGRRHYPSCLSFQNGPTQGEDVFIPLSQILGGEEQIGNGWQMLMGALAAGRGISLPSLATAGGQFSAQTTGAYARIRKQFGIPIGNFEGVREALARIAGSAYLIDSGRLLTMVGLDLGEHPAVISAILKYHATERMRQAVNDAMDIHGGKAIIEGPRNYLGNAYRAIPVGITVEGANILTRSLIIFGQGAIRCHPYLMREMEAVSNLNQEKGLEDFDLALFAHLGYQASRAWLSFFHNLTFGIFARAPEAGPATPYYKQLSRVCAALSIVSEISIAVLGGALKRKESLSARLGDILSEIYLLSAALKRFSDDGMPTEDLPLLDWCFADGLYTIECRFDAVIRNFPSPLWGLLMRALALPAGRRRRPPTDRQMNACAEILLNAGPARERLTSGVFIGTNTQVSQLEAAFHAVIKTDPIEKRMAKAGLFDIEEGVVRNVLSTDEAAQLHATRQLVKEIVQVDDFAPEELKSAFVQKKG